MSQRIAVYVLSVCALAATAATGVFFLTGGTEHWRWQAGICFAVLGMFAQALGHTIGRGASGTISFIPFVTLALLVPDATTIIAVGLVVAMVEAGTKREITKAVFNVAQHCLAIALAILAYRYVGGVPFLDYPQAFTRVSDQPVVLYLPSILMIVVYLWANNLAVSGAIAVSERKRILETWRANSLSTALYDVLSLPFVLMFVGVYSVWGPVGAILLAAPMLAVRQLYKTNWQLQRANQDLLQLMVAAIEARDPYTSGHSRRVSAYARIIGECIGVGGRQLDRLTTAALLHDVGKIHESFAPILQKPGKLTPEERTIMETHPCKSAELVAHVSHLHDVVKPVLHHHENWDGSGYPSGLKGEEIPLESRIIMIADTIDAMTTDRPYRKALGEAEVRREILKFRGQQFDPEMCDTLLRSTKFGDLFAGLPHSPRPAPRVLSIRRWRERVVSA